jgi:hypothetical protein
MRAINPFSLTCRESIARTAGARRDGFSRRYLALALGCALLAGGSSAWAYPPAPYHSVYGLVRDQYGTPIMNSQAQVLMETPSGTELATAIIPGLAVGVNYELRVPMDSGITADTYRSNALETTAQYTMSVVVNGITNVPLQLVGGDLQLGQPAQMTRVDLTLGADANGDGIPDAWEKAFLASLGSQETLTNLNAGADIAGDGRTLMQEFLLGTYPFDPGDAFAVCIVGRSASGTTLEFPTMTGRFYSILGSPDLQHWTSLPFRLVADGPDGGLRTNYMDSVIEKLQVQAVAPTNLPPMQFFKVQLQ